MPPTIKVLHCPMFENRQGVKVFESNDYANDWDGTLNGTPLPDGDYYYIIQCDDSEEPLTGGVRILRQ